MKIEERVPKGVLILILKAEIIKNPKPNEENNKIPNIDVVNDPNLLFPFPNPSPKKSIPIFSVYKGDI